jgi:glutamate transport system permease protein
VGTVPDCQPLENLCAARHSGTLTAAAISIVLAGILGAALGVGRLMPNAVVRWACSAFVEFFRAVPVLIMMIFAYFLYAQYDVFPPKHLALAGVVTGLTLYNSAVIAEILRAGIAALPRGQSEAAASLGLRWGQTMRSIPAPSHHVDAPRADLAVGGGAQGHGHRVPDHVRRNGPPGHRRRIVVRQLHPGADRDRPVDDRGELHAVLAGGAFGAPVAALAAGPRPLDAQAIEQEGAPGARVKRAD